MVGYYLMKLLHNITVTIFDKDEDDRILPFFRRLFPDDWKKAGINYRKEAAEAYDQSAMMIHSLKIHKQRVVEAGVARIYEFLPDHERKRLVADVANRVDDEAFWFVRLDRESALAGELRLTEEGDCVHLRIKAAAYPKNKENGIAAVSSFLQKIMRD